MQKPVNSLFRVPVLLLMGLLALLAFSACQGIPSPAETEAPPPTPELSAYSVEDLEQWVYGLFLSATQEDSRFYEAAEAEGDERIHRDLQRYSDHLFKQDLRFWYSVEDFHFSTRDYGDYVELTVRMNFKRPPEALDTLPRVENLDQALASQQEKLAAGETEFSFLAPSDWGQEDLAAAAHELLLNSVEIAAESGSYSYYLIPDGQEDYSYVGVTANYSLDEEALAAATGEMRRTLDEMAEEIRAQELTDQRALYRAAALAVMDRTEYDDDSLIASYRDDLSDEQKMCRSAYGAVVAGHTVCSGYAMAFKALCDRLDLPCWVMDGYQNGGAHAWNMIQLEGETLYMDCTFCDASYGEGYLFIKPENLDNWGYYYSVDQGCPWAD